MNSQKQRSAIPHHRRSAKRPAAKPTPLHLLVVDDDNRVRESLKNVLTEEGFVVLTAANGDEALVVAETYPVDLVILDLNMPVRNGWDTFERLSAEHPLLPVIIATARSNQIFTALGAGVGALLEKPLDIPHLLITVRRLLTEPAEDRLRRLVGQGAPLEYKPAQGRLHTSLTDSAHAA